MAQRTAGFGPKLMTSDVNMAVGPTYGDPLLMRAATSRPNSITAIA